MFAGAEGFRAFHEEVVAKGYHIFSWEHAAKPGFYPNDFPTTPEYNESDIQENDQIVIRVFFAVDELNPPTIESGKINLEVEWFDIETYTVFANILTELPSTFALAKNTTIEVELDEILHVERPVS